MKRRSILWIRLVLWTVVIFFLCTLPLPKIEMPKMIPYMDKLAHFGIFFLFSAFTFAWLQENRLFVKVANIALTLLLTAFYGALIEWLQGYYFERSSELWDWIADMLGGIFGILTYPFLHRCSLLAQQWVRKLFFKNSS